MTTNDADKVFTGSIPDIYDQFMVPMLFAPYAANLSQRLAGLKPGRVLETAAGTGVLTRAIAARLPETEVTRNGSQSADARSRRDTADAGEGGVAAGRCARPAVRR